MTPHSSKHARLRTTKAKESRSTTLAIPPRKLRDPVYAKDAMCVVRVTVRGKVMTRRISQADVEEAIATIVNAALDGELGACPDFAFGYAAALDMFIGGTLDFMNPIGMVQAAKHDVENISRDRRMVTNFMPIACEAIGARK